MTTKDSPGTVITFYSYKGGTGRSMALSNIACWLARENKDILIIDWDLEAPGLHRYFHDKILMADKEEENIESELESHIGLIDLFSEVELRMRNSDPGNEDEAEEFARDAFRKIDLETYFLQTELQGLRLLKAGRFDARYPEKVNTFDWRNLYERNPSIFQVFAEEVSAQFDFILVDARTGITDTGGICTHLLPEKLVVVFTPNLQSLTGVSELMRKATTYRRESDDLRPLLVYPLPSRIEASRELLQNSWRHGDASRGIKGYQKIFEEVFSDIYDLADIDLSEYFDEVQIQHSPDYAYGEEIAMLLAESSDRLSLARSYRTFGQWLIRDRPIWSHRESVRPLCFVLMPFGKKPDTYGGMVDFDAVYHELISPAMQAAGLDVLRADEEMTGGIIHKPMYERLILCDYAVADVTTASASVFYELGVRHAARPGITILVFAEGQTHAPFDLAPFRALPYKLGPDGLPTDVETRKAALTQRLREARDVETDSPLFQLIPDYPNVTYAKSDVFRDKVRLSAKLRSELAEARRQGVNAVRKCEAKLGDLKRVETGVVVDLFLSYRAVKAWGDMILLVDKMAPPLTRSLMVQEQLAAALNRAGRGEEAEGVLEALIGEHGPSSETCGILGRVYKDRWEAAAKAGNRLEAARWLKKSIDVYLQGFEADQRDAYPGINAVTLMEVRDPTDSRIADLRTVVRYAVERRITGRRPDYWDYATQLELAVHDKNEVEAAEALANSLASVREPWEPETTARNLRLLRQARAQRGDVVPWAQQIEDALRTAGKRISPD